MTTTTREDLADVIGAVTDNWDEPLDSVHDIPQIVNAILAAGYRKPRVIESAAELDALPVGSVVLVADTKCGDECAWQLFDDVNELRDEYGDKAQQAWASAAYSAEKSSAALFKLGAITLLHEGAA